MLKKSYPIDCISYPTSDLELETWVEPTIQKAIARGKKLQEQKSLSSARNNTVFVKSPRLAKGNNLSRRKSPIRRWNNKRASNTPVVKRTSETTSRDDSSSYKNPRLIGRPVCSMRISELAVPTKRQCIAAWRANARVLPENMIHRLKQRVMDQEPIVKVSDAINCLKHDNHTSNTRGNVIWQSKRTTRKINKESINKNIRAEYQVLSARFGKKIAQHLLRPMNITLNSQLKNVSSIISEEIYNIMKDSKIFRTNKAHNDRMVPEISEKVTIWIAKVLDDSTDKLLEEELKDLEQQEGPVLDILDDVVDGVLHKCIKTPPDSLTPDFQNVSSGDDDNRHNLEDIAQGDKDSKNEVSENGDVVSKNAELPETESTGTGDEATQGDKNAELSDTGVVRADEVAAQGDDDSKNIEVSEMSTINVDDEGTTESYVTKQINQLIDSLKHDDFDNHLTYQLQEPDIDVLYSNIDTQLELPQGENEDIQNNIANNYISDTPDLKELDGVENNYELGIETSATPLHSAEEVPEISTMHNQDKDDEKLEDNISVEPETNDIIENPTDTNDEQTSNVSDAIEVLTAELSEEKNKTVQFSKENLGLIKEDEQDRDTSQSNDEQQFQDIAFESPDIDFASPNDRLLSDADESWPHNVSATKPSASVTSMGKILESDEKYSISLNDTDNLVQNTEKIYENSDKEENEYSLQQHTEKIETNYEEKSENTFENPPQIYEPSDEKKNEHSSQNTENNYEASDEKKNEQSSQNTENNYEASDEKKNELSSQNEEKNYDTSGEKRNEHLSQNTEKFHEVSCDEKNPHDNLHYIPEMMPHGLVKELDSNQVIRIMQKENDNSSFIVENYFLPPFMEPEKSIKSLKNESVILNEDSQDSRNLLESEVMGSVIQKCDQSRGVEHMEQGTTSYQIDQRPFRKNPSKKFDYRVHDKTAPAWIRRGQGEPNEHRCACRPSRLPVSEMNKMEAREQEILKWCQDLDFVLMNLDKWKNWLDYISNYITGLKQKSVTYKDDIWGQWPGSRWTVDRLMGSLSPKEKDAWRKFDICARGLKLQRQNDTVKFKISHCPVKYCTNCGRTKSIQVKKRHHRNHSIHYYSEVVSKGHH